MTCGTIIIDFEIFWSVYIPIEMQYNKIVASGKLKYQVADISKSNINSA